MDAEEVDVAFLWKRLSPYLDHLDVDDRRRVGVALIIAYGAHDGQFRKSGEPFITHPVEVARILGGLRLDRDTIISGLLHDTVEDTDRISFEDIGKRFGPCVRRIVEAETRLTKVSPSDSSESIEDRDLQHFFTCISQDIRIILVKLADRLHNMRTMDSMKSHKQKEKASETLQVYAPLAGVLGLDAIKEELEELSLRYLDPDMYFEIKNYLKVLEATDRRALDEAKATLTKQLESDVLLQQQIEKITITTRQKSIYNIYKLYKTSGCKLSSRRDLRQVAQLHVLLESDQSSAEMTKTCYYVMGAIHLLWNPVPGKLKDCIATPKPTSWKGLVTTVWPSSNSRLITPIDVLIQTSDMTLNTFNHALSNRLKEWANAREFVPKNDENSDSDDDTDAVDNQNDISRDHVNGNWSNGVSEWKTEPNHVNGVSPSDNDLKWNSWDQAQLWMERLQKWQEEVGKDISPSDYVACVRNDFLTPMVYVFTPANELIPLPKGATVLDFAYQMHTDIGNRAVGAKVDGRNVGPDYVLRNAQVVEISIKNWMISREYLDILRSRLTILKTTSAIRKMKAFIEKYSSEYEKTWPNAFAKDQPSVEREECFWIRVSCEDRKGLLEDVAGVIAGLGMNIERYSGQVKDSGPSLMEYHVQDPSGSSLEELCQAVEAVDGCSDVVTGCTLPSWSTAPQGWYLPSKGS